MTNLANASSLIYHSLHAFPAHFGTDKHKAVNWCGFYLDSSLFPERRCGQQKSPTTAGKKSKQLWLGPFCGKPACQFIEILPNPRGVCADAFIRRLTHIVSDVSCYPNHIACDEQTKSEIVLPLILQQGDSTEALGVLDLDCLALNGFDADDKTGLERITELIVRACYWQ